MEIDKETEKLFVGRYIDLWIHFNPGKNIPPGLRDVGKKYCQYLSEEGVDYQTFDRICKIVEKGFQNLGYDFNLVAYVVDFVNMERMDKAQADAAAYSQPIKLPNGSKPLFSDNPHMARCIEILERNKVSGLIDILERLNYARENGEYTDYRPECESCQDTGWISLPENTAAICTCRHGQRLKGSNGSQIEAGFDAKTGKKLYVKQATIEECKESARFYNNGFLIMRRHLTLVKNNNDSDAPF